MKKKCITSDSRGFVTAGKMYYVEDAPHPWANDYLVYLDGGSVVYIHKSRFDKKVKPLPTAEEVKKAKKAKQAAEAKALRLAKKRGA